MIEYLECSFYCGSCGRKMVYKKTGYPRVPGFYPVHADDKRFKCSRRMGSTNTLSAGWKRKGE